MNARRVQELILTAQGRKKADVVIDNIRLVNVYSREIHPSFSVGLSQDRIAYVGPKPDPLIGPKTRVVTGQGKYLLPGFIDAHTHLDSIFTLEAYTPYALATGNTTAITEMAMIANVLGKTGVDWFMEEAGRHPLRVFFLAPALAPPYPELETSRGLSREAFRRIIKKPQVLGVGEAYWPRVTGLDPRALSAYALAHRLNKTREGHAAGAREENLMAYTAAGTTSCHEATTLAEALERLRLGLAVMIREGFVRREFEAIAPIARQGIDLRRVMIVSDLFDPADLVEGRGMNALLARAVKLGIDPLVALQMVTRNVADYYGLQDLGGVAPGKIADLVLVEDLRDFDCRQVWVGGRLAVDRGRPLLPSDPFVYPPEARRSFSLSRIEPGILALPAPHPETTVRVVKAVGSTITRESFARLVSQKGFLEADPRQDILKMAVFQRFDAHPPPALGFAQGIGLKKGAVATSLGWDANNLLVIGVSDQEMALAVNRLLDLAGGLVVAAGEHVLAEMPLPIMGLISEEPLPVLQRQIQNLELAFRTLGSDLERPFLTLQTFCFTGLPFIRMTDKGLADIRTKKFLNLIVEESSPSGL
jgi:adenine deaminase